MTISTNNYSNRQICDFLTALLKDRTVGKRIFSLTTDDETEYNGPRLNIATQGNANLVPHGIYLSGLIMLRSAKIGNDLLNPYLPLDKIRKISVERIETSGNSLLHRLPPEMMGRVLEYIPFLSMNCTIRVDSHMANLLRRNEYPLIPFIYTEELNSRNSADHPMTLQEYIDFEKSGMSPVSFPYIYHLDLSRSKITNERLEEILNKFPRLTSLNLNGCSKITNLRCLAGRAIEHLNLDSTQITDTCLSTLPNKLPLQHLNLRDTKITDVSITNLLKYPTLQHLNLQKCLHFSDAGVAILKNLPTLKYLDFFRCDQLTNLALEHLGQFSALVYLGLGNKNITDVGLRHLTRLPHLKCIDMSNSTKITTLGVNWEILNSLKHIILSGCPKISDASAMHLTTALPQLKRLTLQHCYQITNTTKDHLETLGILNEPSATLPWGNNNARMGRLYIDLD